MAEEKAGGYRGSGRAEGVGPPRSVPSGSARPDASVAQDDLAAILRELGLGDHARPESPHEVVQGLVLPTVREVVRQRDEARSELLHWRSEAAQLRQQLTVLCPAGVPTSVEHEQAHREMDAEFRRAAPGPEEGETRG